MIWLIWRERAGECIEGDVLDGLDSVQREVTKWTNLHCFQLSLKTPGIKVTYKSDNSFLG